MDALVAQVVDREHRGGAREDRMLGVMGTNQARDPAGLMVMGVEHVERTLEPQQAFQSGACEKQETLPVVGVGLAARGVVVHPLAPEEAPLSPMIHQQDAQRTGRPVGRAAEQLEGGRLVAHPPRDARRAERDTSPTRPLDDPGVRGKRHHHVVAAPHLLGGERAHDVRQAADLDERLQLAGNVDHAARGNRFGAGRHRSAMISRRYCAASSGGVGLMKKPEPISKPATRVSLGMISMCQW